MSKSEKAKQKILDGMSSALSSYAETTYPNDSETSNLLLLTMQGCIEDILSGTDVNLKERLRIFSKGHPDNFVEGIIKAIPKEMLKDL